MDGLKAQLKATAQTFFL